MVVFMRFMGVLQRREQGFAKRTMGLARPMKGTFWSGHMSSLAVSTGYEEDPRLPSPFSTSNRITSYPAVASIDMLTCTNSYHLVFESDISRATTKPRGRNDYSPVQWPFDGKASRSGLSVDTKRNDMVASIWIRGVPGQKKCAHTEINFYLIMGRDTNSADDTF
jgi:hypothetical protein